MNIKPFELKRMGMMFCVLLPSLTLIRYLGYESLVITLIIAGVTGGVSVIVFPDPDRKV
jgi:hypothetical protein